MKTQITPIPYQEHPLESYSQSIVQPYGFVLTGGRYTIMGWDPVSVITEGADPFSVMQQQIENLSSTISPCGGWYGFLGYELGEMLHNHLPQRPRDLPLPDFCMGLYEEVLVFDHHEKSAYIATHELPGVSPKRRNTQINPQSPSTSSAPLNFESNFSFESYREAFDLAQSALRRGDCYQVNLAQRFSADFSGNPWDYFMSLMRINPAPFAAYYQLPNSAIISCSPERFIKIDKNQIETKPIKGTCARHPDPESDHKAAVSLQHSEKNRAENLMIVDLMRHDLGQICEPGSVQVPSLFAIESYPSVHHLVSTVAGTLKSSAHPLQALKACFPGGSITGAPKLAAMQQIQSLEPNARHVYCGSIGYCDFSGTLDMNIAIRTAVITEGRCHVWAGGGIVLDSVCEDEYQECLDKIAPFMR